ncbi:hypothetical protein Tco_1428181 [Tanacetum coccineum]
MTMSILPQGEPSIKRLVVSYVTKNIEESWALLEDLALYENERWNGPRDFTKLVKAIYLPQDVPNTSDHHLIELENQVQRLMEAHLAPKSSVQVNKIASSCEICSGPHNTQYCMKNPEQAFVEYASSRNNEVGVTQTKLERVLSDFDSHQEKRLSSLGTQLKQQQDDVINKINTLWKVVSKKCNNAPAHDNAGDSMARVNAELLLPKCVYFVNIITVIRKDNESREAGTIESDVAKDNGRNTIVEGKKETEEGLDSSEPVIEEEESRDIKQNNPNNGTRGETKEEEEVEEETKESEE